MKAKELITRRGGTMSERDDEIRRMEQRRARLQQRREQAQKQRNMMLCSIAGVIVVILFIIVFAVSCNRSKDAEVVTEATTVAPQTTTAEEKTTAQETTTAEETTTALASKMAATDDGINVREKPNTSAGIIKQLDKGEEVNILSEEGDWYKVDVDGRVGYVSKEFLKASNDSNSSDETGEAESEEETTTVDEDMELDNSAE